MWEGQKGDGREEVRIANGLRFVAHIQVKG